MNRGWWIIGVSVFVVVAFFIPDRTGEIWTSVVSAIAVVGVFYLGLLVYVFRKGKSTDDKLIGFGIIGLITVVLVFNGIIEYQHALFQAKTFTDIRKTVDEAIILATSQKPLLKSLKSYHNKSTDNQNWAIEDVFKTKYGDNIRNEGATARYIPEIAEGDEIDESPFIYYQQTESRDTVGLVGLSLIVEGRDSTFSNFNGQKGFMQYRTILTKKGVDYEREN